MSLAFASTNEKSRVLNLVYRMVNSIYGNKVKIERDPLHRRYEVNRYGVYLSSKTMPPKLIAGKLEKALLEKLNAEIKDHGYSKSILHKTINNRCVRISMDSEGRADRLYIMIH